MNRGGNSTLSQGFTVVETLIVLAVTSILFLIAAVTINGRQQKTDFQVGIRNLQQQIQQVINETQSGYYPSNGNFTCRVVGSSLNIAVGGTTGQGDKDQCVFAGKTLIVGGTNHKDNYVVYSLAARRVNAAGENVSQPSEAAITAIAPGASNANAPDLSIRTTLPNGLEYVWSKVNGGVANTAVIPIAFLSSFGNFSGSGNSTGGSQRIELRTYQTNFANGNEEVDNIASENGPTAYGNVLSSVELCFKSGGTDQSGLVKISSGLRVSYSIKSGTTCGA